MILRQKVKKKPQKHADKNPALAFSFLFISSLHSCLNHHLLPHFLLLLSPPLESKSNRISLIAVISSLTWKREANSSMHMLSLLIQLKLSRVLILVAITGVCACVCVRLCVI